MDSNKLKEKIEKMKDVSELDIFKLEQTNELIMVLNKLRIGLNG